MVDTSTRVNYNLITIIMNGIYNPALKPEIQQKDVIAVFINNLIIIGFSLGALLALFFLITGAIQWITSSGDKAGLESAQNKIKYAIIGLIILALIFLFINLIGNFLGIDLLHLKFPFLGEEAPSPSIQKPGKPD